MNDEKNAICQHVIELLGGLSDATLGAVVYDVVHRTEKACKRATIDHELHSGFMAAVQREQALRAAHPTPKGVLS